MQRTITLLLLVVSIAGCNRNKNDADAYGNFEADEVVVSSEATGKLLVFSPGEGMHFKAGDTVAVVDSMQPYLRKKQLEASIAAIYKKLPDKGAQLAVYDEKIKSLNREVARTANLVQANAAPQKQLDDLKSDLEVADRQRAALETSLNTETSGMLAEVDPLRYELLQADDQLSKCIVTNPIDGIVLNTIVKTSEIVQPGKPLYEIAPLDPILLRAYVVEAQLPEIKLGDSVTVKTDAPDGSLVSRSGKITWISSESEFTPKIIQTREERVSQVYAVKIKVVNDGSLKIGMPAEVYFKHPK